MPARRRRPASALLAAFLLLAACGIQQDGALDNTTGALATPPVIKLTPSGIGEISHGAAYSEALLRRALPGFELKTVKTFSEGEFKWLLAAFKNGSQQIQFEPDRSGRKVRRIHVVGLEAAGPNEERLGMSFAETGGGRLECRPGKQEWSGMTVCETSDATLAYVYAPSDYNGADGQLPPERDLAKARLVRMVWRATEG